MIHWKVLKLDKYEETKLRRAHRYILYHDDYFDDEYFNTNIGYNSLKDLLSKYADSTSEDILFRFIRLFGKLDYSDEIMNKYETLYEKYKS